MIAMGHLLFVSGRAIADDAESIHEVLLVLGGSPCLVPLMPLAVREVRSPPAPKQWVPGAGEVRQEQGWERVETSPRNGITGGRE
jgi:hypothetical protein